MWAGLADPLVLPQQSVDYYKNVRKLFGSNTDKFFKLFLVPGMGHCWEMESRIPDQMSMLTVIENWVEKDISPDFIPIKSLNMKSEVKNGFLRPFPLMAEY
jgi:feruloyl esterase